MLPQEVLSSELVDGPFEYPRNVPRAPLIDYEYGGVAIQDPTLGLMFQVWKGEYTEGAIMLSAQNVAPFAVVTAANVVDFGFTFDQNMQPFVAYELANGTVFFRWFDGTVPGFVTTQLPAGSACPRCTLDDKRLSQTAASDIILAYVRAGSLFFRAQRDRYEDEYTLSTEIGASRLLQIGMNRRLRMQFQLSL